MVGSIDPEGTQNASTTDERTSNATATASSSDSTFCRSRDLGGCSRLGPRQKAKPEDDLDGPLVSALGRDEFDGDI
jgi:hypothetical protein